QSTSRRPPWQIHPEHDDRLHDECGSQARQRNLRELLIRRRLNKMRPEKKYLVEEVRNHLDKSEYVFLTNYDRITVEETSTLRKSLAEHNAEFHVVKNSVLNIAAQEREYPDLKEWLAGPTAIIVGG